MTHSQRMFHAVMAQGVHELAQRAGAKGCWRLPVQLQGQPIYAIGSPELLSYLLRQRQGDNPLCDNSSPANGMLRRAMGEGVFTTNDPECWRTAHELWAPFFRRSQVADIAAHTTLDWWQGQQPDLIQGRTVALVPRFIQLSVRVLSRVVLGELPAAQASQVPALTEAVFSNMALNLVRLALPDWLPGGRRYQEAIGRLDQLVYQIIQGRRDQPTTTDNLLSTLIASGKMGDQQIRDQLFTAFLAGFDSMAVTLGWAAEFLARDWPLQQALQAELASGWGQLLSREHRHHSLLSRVVTETLRLRPSFPVFFGGAARDIELPDHLPAELRAATPVIPQGAQLLFVPLAAQTSSKVWGDRASEFDPGRWDAASGTAAQRSVMRQAFLPFGLGERRCLGEHLALTVVPQALGLLVERFDLLPVRQKLPPGSYSMTLSPAGGATVRLASRP
ncbi:MAG TPA: cytochrome P450 [Candidatus Saccharimonadia bacterium]|nr:cytochrome P450 [Candidatus Saccharimonadia bacterium]